jgi:hypothetical protein
MDCGGINLFQKRNTIIIATISLAIDRKEADMDGTQINHHYQLTLDSVIQRVDTDGYKEKKTLFTVQKRIYEYLVWK